MTEDNLQLAPEEAHIDAILRSMDAADLEFDSPPPSLWDDIEAAMRACDGVKEQAWRKLGLRSRYQLYRLLKEHGIV